MAVRPFQATAQLRETYARRFAGHEQRRREIWNVLSRCFFQRWVDPGDTVLDLGAGYCEYINSIKAARKLALDLNPATHVCAAKEVIVLAQDVAQPWQLASDSVDILFTSNFLEHLTSRRQLAHCLCEAARVRKPRGRIIALGPNIRFAYDVYWGSDRSLVEALGVHGFSLELVIPRFLPYTMKGHASTHPSLVRVYLAFPLARRILGKQFLVVARVRRHYTVPVEPLKSFALSVRTSRPRMLRSRACVCSLRG